MLEGVMGQLRDLAGTVELQPQERGVGALILDHQGKTIIMAVTLLESGNSFGRVLWTGTLENLMAMMANGDSGNLQKLIGG